MTSTRTAAGLASALLLVGFLLPIYWILAASVSPEEQLFAAPTLVPSRITLDHYRAVIIDRQFWTPIKNSLIVSTSTTLLCLVFGSLCAYALARLPFPRKRAVLYGVLGVTMFPQVAIVSPLYLLLRAVGLIDTYAGLVLPYLAFAMPLAIWLLVSFFRQLPGDIEDAARVDGAGRLRVLWEVTLPLALPGLIATGIITFIYCYNEFLFALSFTVGPEHHTVPVALALFRGQYQVSWGEIFAGVTVSTAPVALLVLLFQRHIVQGLTAGAVKG